MAGVRGASGRRPAPAKLKLLNGRSPGRDSSGNLVKPPPPFERAAPEPPEWLSAEARKQWALCAPSWSAWIC
jgi:phage terminase small subunit